MMHCLTIGTRTHDVRMVRIFTDSCKLCFDVSLFSYITEIERHKLYRNIFIESQIIAKLKGWRVVKAELV